MTKFIADCGGLLGLFIGFSAMTVAELVYIFTFGSSCKFRRENQNRTTTKPNQIETMSNEIVTNSKQIKIILNQIAAMSNQINEIKGHRFQCRRRNNSF